MESLYNIGYSHPSSEERRNTPSHTLCVRIHALIAHPFWSSGPQPRGGVPRVPARGLTAWLIVDPAPWRLPCISFLVPLGRSRCDLCSSLPQRCCAPSAFLARSLHPTVRQSTQSPLLSSPSSRFPIKLSSAFAPLSLTRASPAYCIVFLLPISTAPTFVSHLPRDPPPPTPPRMTPPKLTRQLPPHISGWR